jgi:hypothetical protein
MSLRHSVVSQSNSATIFRYASCEAANPALRPRLTVLHSEDSPSYDQWIAGYAAVPPDRRGTSIDVDGDGRSNLEEYALRSLPHVPYNSPAGLRLVRTGGGGWYLVFPGGANLPPGVYPQLQHRAALSGAGWETLSRAAITTAGADLVFTPTGLPAGAPTGFFRLRLLLVDSG